MSDKKINKQKLNRFTIFFLIYCHYSVAFAQNTNDFQQQLQRLQSAMTSARLANPQDSTQPVFNSQTQAVTGIAPPAPPPPSQLAATPTSNAAIPSANQGALPPAAPTSAPPPASNNSAATTPDVDTGVNIRDQAFSETANNLLPLTADQIRVLHGIFSNTQRAVGEVTGIPPKPTSTSKIVNLSPGATPPIIRLAAGFVSSLVFLDATGAAWPIESYDLGDPKSYNIQWDKKSNMLLVQAISEYKSGNLAVMLRGSNTPIMLTLLPGQRAVDYRVDLRVPGLGPNAEPAAMPETLPGASNPILLDVLNGIAPVGARALKVQGRDCSIWLLNNKIYLRTRLTILSPAWISSLSSADGMHAYEMRQTPVVLASENGKMIKLTIQGL